MEVFGGGEGRTGRSTVSVGKLVNNAAPNAPVPPCSGHGLVMARQSTHCTVIESQLSTPDPFLRDLTVALSTEVALLMF